MPTTIRGLEARLDPSIQFTIPSDWFKHLPTANADQQPYVGEGYLGTHQVKGTSGSTDTSADVGVDYRGIILVESAGDGLTTADRYVAGFTVYDKNKPDILFILTIPIVDAKGGYTDLDVLPDGRFTLDTIPVGERQFGITAPILIEILKNPLTVGRRMVISIRISSTATTDLETTPDHQVLADAIKNGLTLTNEPLDIRLTLRNLHIPHDLHP
jgi:hypothetical protein